MKIRSDIPESRLIVGCTRDSQIHVDAGAFQLVASGLYDKLISLAEAKFMAACAIGNSWGALLDKQPLFGIDEDGVPCFVKGGFVMPVNVPGNPAPSPSVSKKKRKKKR
jgi:hypothetical protein